MQKSSILFLLVCFVSTLTAQSNYITKTLDLPMFSGIALAIDAEVFLRQSDEQTVEIEGPEILVNQINNQVRGGLWSIEYLEDMELNRELTIRIGMPYVDFISNSSSGEIRGVNAFTDLVDLDLKISGSGDIFIDVDVIDLDLKISGSGDLGLKGKTLNQSINIMGSGDVMASGLDSETCQVVITGNGNCKVRVADELDISIIGNGDLFYKGNPKVRSHVVGTGDVNG